MKICGRKSVVAFFLFGSLAQSCVAQQLPAYPAKAIRLIVPTPPGGGNDIMARLAGQRLSEAWGKQVVVDNRSGAGGAINQFRLEVIQR